MQTTMKNLTKNLATLLIIAGLFSAVGIHSANGQDTHLSQYDASPVWLNPALTGRFDNADLRIATNYRSQWGALSSNFITTAASFDMPFKDRWGIGGYVLNYDQATVLNTFGLSGSASYLVTDPNRSNYVLAAGIQLGFIYKRTNPDRLIFDNQFNGTNFDSDLPSMESFDRLNRWLPEVALGFTYYDKDKAKTYHPYAGLSVFHLTQPNESFLNSEKSKLPLRWAINAGSKVEINDLLVLDPSALFMLQGKSVELNFGMLAYYKLQNTNYDVLGGLSYRNRDAVIVHAGVKHNQNVYRVSYDINTSPLNEYTNGRGAIEFSVVYSGRKRAKTVNFLN